MTDSTSAGERAMMAERAWSLAKRLGDDRLRVAALLDYRAAMCDLRAQRISEIEAQLVRLDAIRHEHRTAALDALLSI